MNFTDEQAKECSDWYGAYLLWKVETWNKTKQEMKPPPPKPKFFDLWAQGEDPLGTSLADTIACKGSELVDPHSVSQATPTPLESPQLEQPEFPNL